MKTYGIDKADAEITHSAVMRFRHPFTISKRCAGGRNRQLHAPVIIAGTPAHLLMLAIKSVGAGQRWRSNTIHRQFI